MAHYRRFATYDLPGILSMDIREIDKLEISASLGVEPEDALLQSMDASDGGLWVAIDRGEIFAVFGVAGFEGGIGVVWFIGTDRVNELSLAFLRGSRQFIESIRPKYRRLTNYVAKENHASIRWLSWLGFQFEREETIFKNPDVPFLTFYLDREEKHHV